jgi:hypothetical protein
MVAIVTLDKDPNNQTLPTIKQSQTIGCACLQLTTLSLNHFKMVEDMGLKLLQHGHLEWQHLYTKFHEHPPIGSKVIIGDTQTDTHKHIDRQASDFISPLSFFESRLKRLCVIQ